MTDSTELAEPADLVRSAARTLRRAAYWSLQMLLVLLAGGVLLALLAWMWIIVFPVLLALLLATVLRPPAAWLGRRGVPGALAALIVVGGTVAVVALVVLLLIPQLTDHIGEIATASAAGIREIDAWLSGPPFELGSGDTGSLLDTALLTLQQNASAILSGVLAVSRSIASGLMTALLTLVMVFLFIKDGARFLPWLVGRVGRRVGRPLAETARGIWAVLGTFVRTQALVSLVDGVVIGLGLLVVGVPLALPLGVLTFVGGFVPVIGPLVAGAFSVLVAMVIQGPTAALVVLAVVLIVQQVGGKVLKPLVQGRGLGLHAGVVLLAVAAGGGLFGITGAFLAVPVTAVAGVLLRRFAERPGIDSESVLTRSG